MNEINDGLEKIARVVKILIKIAFLLFIVGFMLTSCAGNKEQTAEVSDPLPSWNDGDTKSAIIDFVERVTEPGSQSFIEVKHRVATFDNDGNLWSEKPFYFQLLFAIDRIKQMAPEHPEWQNKQPYKAVLEDDMEKVLEYGLNGLLQLTMTSHAGVTTDEFTKIASNWLATSRHPRFDRPYNEMIYQPMIELLEYLRDNEFKTFVVSGGGIEFMRVWVEDAYGIPPDQVIGSSIMTELDTIDGKLAITRLPQVNFIDDKAGKPIGINQYIGQRPIFASGNSDGDLHMIRWTTEGEGPRFGLYLHHTDSVREWAYDRSSNVGRLDQGLDEAKERGWTVIDMTKDWNVVYPWSK